MVDTDHFGTFKPETQLLGIWSTIFQLAGIFSAR
jgi:hypothetical protein